MTELNDSIAVKDMISAASPLIKTLVETFVKPKLEKFRDKFKSIDSDKVYIPTEEHFQEYYHRTYKKLAVINTLVFNNSQRFLKEIYLPLTLSSTNEEKIKYQIDSYPEKMCYEYGNILITDTAGMGKSTLMKRIFIDIIDQNIGIPIIVELRRLTKVKTILSEIQEQLNSINKDFDNNLLLELLAEGGFIIILDGYDEISLTDREVVTADLQDFISKASNNEFFITSRPEKALLSFGNFQEFRINPLNKKEAFELLRKYDHQGSVSSLLIKKLQEQEMANIEEFLTNPLLVSLLFTAFEHKQAIPFKKYLFYRQVYDANFESHDLTKGDSYTHDKYSKLEIDDFHRVLRHLGFSCFKLQKIEFSKDEILKLISDSKEFCAGLKFNESSFLEDLLRTVPLFTQDGNYYRWAHKSLQEYFAAQFIYLDSKEKQNAILDKLYNHSNLEKFINVIDLYYDMDYKTFRNRIERYILTEFKQYVDNHYNFDYPEISPESIIERKETSFFTDSFLFKATQKDKKHPFEGEKLSKMLNTFSKKNGFDQSRFSGILVRPPLFKFVYAVHYQNSKTVLLNLLARKKSDYIKAVMHSDIENKSMELDFDFNKEYELKVIDDNPENQFNSKSNFQNVSEFMQATKINSFLIDYEKGLDFLERIEKSIENENKDDFLVGDI
ncbi:NACHT domain-containing protein [Winogradskyella sp. HB-48]|uniref:NACHT domain-containing protein n=1 Tax=Winogradskyella sp. HB-48 TaxID=3416808 RepID=UPI003CE80ED5